MPTDTDIKLVIKAQMGDTSAFEELVNLYYTGILSVCRSLVPTLQDAEDCTQDTFLKAFKHINGYNSELSLFFTWLYRIAVNTCYDFRRKNNKKITISIDESFDVEGNDSYIQIVDTSPLPDKELINSLSDERVQQIIDSLPLQYSRILRLRDISGLSYNDIAFIENINEGTVKSRLARARSAFIKAASSEDLYD